VKGCRASTWGSSNNDIKKICSRCGRYGKWKRSAGLTERKTCAAADDYVLVGVEHFDDEQMFAGAV
jgi:hypothetical protein